MASGGNMYFGVGSCDCVNISHYNEDRESEGKDEAIGEEVRSKLYGAGVEEGEPVAVIVSEIDIVCGYLFEYMFASLFDVVIQTVVSGLISSLNHDICDVTGCIKWIYVHIRIWFISNGFFIVYLKIVYVAGILNVVFAFGGLIKYNARYSCVTNWFFIIIVQVNMLL